MSDDATNTVDLKKRARRRLVGAAALALLAVIVLPLVMDSNPKPVGQDIQIRIPSQDGESVVTNVLPGAVTPAPATVSSDVEAPTTGAPAFKPVEPVAKAATPEVESKPVAEQKAKVEAPKTEQAKDVAAPKTEAARAVAVLEGKDAQWIVQLGAYRNAATVKTLTVKLKAMGLPVYTEKTDSPAGATRVRAGPFKSRESAENAMSRAKKIGVDGVVAQKQ